MTNNANNITIYESLLKEVIKILPTIYQNEAKVSGKMSEFRV